jgi:hypothetical protein
LKFEKLRRVGQAGFLYIDGTPRSLKQLVISSFFRNAAAYCFFVGLYIAR